MVIYFNPRTREGCDQAILRLRSAAILISIHAPVKGATCKKLISSDGEVQISIHAPVKGATFRGLLPFDALQ